MPSTLYWPQSKWPITILTEAVSIVLGRNSSCAGFVLEDMKIYFHILSFLNADMVQVAENQSSWTITRAPIQYKDIVLPEEEIPLWR